MHVLPYCRPPGVDNEDEAPPGAETAQPSVAPAPAQPAVPYDPVAVALAAAAATLPGWFLTGTDANPALLQCKHALSLRHETSLDYLQHLLTWMAPRHIIVFAWPTLLMQSYAMIGEGHISS